MKLNLLVRIPVLLALFMGSYLASSSRAATLLGAGTPSFDIVPTEGKKFPVDNGSGTQRDSVPGSGNVSWTVRLKFSDADPIGDYSITAISALTHAGRSPMDSEEQTLNFTREAGRRFSKSQTFELKTVEDNATSLDISPYVTSLSVNIAGDDNVSNTLSENGSSQWEVVPKSAPESLSYSFLSGISIMVGIILRTQFFKSRKKEDYS